MREYAATESVSDLAVLGRAYRALKNAQCNLYCDETWLSTSKISKNGGDEGDGDDDDADSSSFGAALVQNVRFGDEELRVAKNAVRSKETLERLRDSAIADDVDGIFALVHDVDIDCDSTSRLPSSSPVETSEAASESGVRTRSMLESAVLHILLQLLGHF